MTTAVRAQPMPRQQLSPIPFGRLLRAEWHKAIDTRAARWLLAAAAITTIGALLIPLLFPRNVAQSRASYMTWAGLGHLRAARASGAGQRSRFHRRPGHQRRSRARLAWRPGRPGTAAVPARRVGDLRDLRAPDGFGLVQRQACLPVPPRPHQRRPAGSGPGEERLRPGGLHPGAPAHPVPAADRPTGDQRADKAPHTQGSRRAACHQHRRSDRVPARAPDQPHLGPGRTNPAGRHRQSH
jgi:hypothetical protein